MQGEDQPNEQVVVEEDDSINLAIDREIQREVAEIKAGRHPNLTDNIEALERAKQKKIDASDRHRKMQINNINALYEYELEDANALFKVKSSSTYFNLEVEGQFPLSLKFSHHTQLSFCMRYLILESVLGTAGGIDQRTLE